VLRFYEVGFSSFQNQRWFLIVQSESGEIEYV
jgi:hypothetical protein